MRQLTFELAPPTPPSLDNYLAGRNAEVLAALERCAGGNAEPVVMLWGGRGVGKTHLLRAVVSRAAEQGRTAAFVASPGIVSTQDPGRLGAHAIVAVDDVDGADDDAQARMFTLCNVLRERGGHLVAAASAPPATLALRDDLRTRLSWGLVYEVLPLADEDKPAALAAYAEARGFRLPPDVIDYLLAHGRRDMGALVATVAALDRLSLAAKRPIGIALVREWLQQPMRFDRHS
jgi:DnaA-homolog protein